MEEAVAAEEDKPVSFSIAGMLVPDFMDMYLEDRRADGIERSTLEGYGYSAKHSKAFFADKQIGNVTAWGAPG